MMTNLFFSKQLLLLAALVCFSCTKDIQSLNTSSDEKGEVRSLYLGIQPQTKTSLTFETGGVKLNWNEGDRIAVVKGEKAYVYELKETTETGIGKFDAVGTGVDLTGNTDNVAIVHISGNSLDNASTSNTSSSVEASVDYMSQSGNGNMEHLSSNGCILQRLLDTPPTSAEELRGSLAPVNSILRFSIAAPAGGLEEGDYPTAFIVTVKSGETSFLKEINVTDKGFDLSRRENLYGRINKMQIHLEDIDRWDSSNPLDVALNLVMDNAAIQSGDEYIFEVQTELGNLYSVTKPIKKKPEAGKVYRISLDGLTLDDCSEFCKAVREEEINPVSVKLFAEFNPYADGTYCYGKTFWQSAYGGRIVVVDPETGSEVYSNVVESGKPGKEDEVFSGEGYSLVEDWYGVGNLKPEKKYKYRPSVSFMANDEVTYYGPWKEFTTSKLEICTDEEGVDLGTGVVWASYNVGAPNHEPEEVGGYYAWGDTEEDKEGKYNESTYKHYEYKNAGWSISKYITGTSSSSDVVLENDDDAAAKNMGSGWRMPTKDEMQALYDKTTKYDMTYKGIRGMAFIGRNGEDGDYGSKNIFIPYGGYKLRGGEVSSGDHYALWSSSLYTEGSGSKKAYSFNNCYPEYPDYKIGFKLSGEERISGRNVRAVKNKATE